MLVLIACAVGDNEEVPDFFGSGAASSPADDPNGGDDHSDDESAGAESSSDDGSAPPPSDGTSESGGFPMPEPADDPTTGEDSGGQQPPPPPPPPMGGDCCTASMSPGCANDPAVEMCVCTGDSFCCTDAWDDSCVSEVANCAPACPGAPPPAQGSPCCSPTGGPGCGDPFAEACVCFIDDYCCNVDWDDECVGLATAACMIC